QRILMTQMSTQVFFISAQAQDALLVPMSSLTFTRAGARANSAKEKKGKKNADAISQRTDIKRSENNHESEATNSAALKRQATLQVVTTNGRDEMRTVTVGVTNRIQAEILAGLNEGETVVTGVRQAGETARTTGEQRGFNPRMLR